MHRKCRNLDENVVQYSYNKLIGCDKLKLTDIKAGEKLEISFNYMDKEYAMDLLVHDKSDCSIILPAILHKDNPVFPMELDSKKIVYKTERGLYEYTEFEMDLKKLNNKYVYCVNCEQIAEKINRREAYRVFIGEEVVIKHFDRLGKEQTFKANLKDLSLTGMGIVSNYEMEEGDIVETLYKADHYRVVLQGTIVRIEECEHIKSKIYGVKFNGRTEVLGKAIIKRQFDNKKRRK